MVYVIEDLHQYHCRLKSFEDDRMGGGVQRKQLHRLWYAAMSGMGILLSSYTKLKYRVKRNLQASQLA